MSREHGLLKHPPFKRYVRACWAIPAAVAIAILSLNYSWLFWSFCFEPRCFNNLLIIYEIPITLITALLALLGIYIIVFRSEQTATQIQQSDILNTFNQYYKHKEETIKALIDAGNRLSFGFDEGERVYKLLFPHNSPTLFSPFSDAKNLNGILILKQVFENFKGQFTSFDMKRLSMNQSDLKQDALSNYRIALKQLKTLGFSLLDEIPEYPSYNQLTTKRINFTHKSVQLKNAGSLLNEIKFICLLSDEDLPLLPRYKEQEKNELLSELEKIDKAGKD
jgi:hypothetical protein